RGLRLRADGGEPAEHLAVVQERGCGRPGLVGAGEPAARRIEDRDRTAERARDRDDELVELAGGNQASQLDRIVEPRARAHPGILAGSATPTCSASADRNVAPSMPSFWLSRMSRSRESQARETRWKNVETTPSPCLAHAASIGRFGSPNRS